MNKSARSTSPSAHLVKYFIATLFAIMTLTISACGWHLRGTTGSTVSFDSIHISTSNRHTELVRQLQKQLKASGVEIVDSATDAAYNLVIFNQQSKRRTATVSASARVSERSLTEKAQFMLVDQNGHKAIPLTDVMVERVYEYNENDVLATNDEARMLKREMSGELARQIFSRLRRVNLPAKTKTDAPAS